MCRVRRPEAIEALRRDVLSGDYATCVARGLGRAYGDSALNEQGAVIVQTRLDRLLHFDPDSGVLTCEGGVSIAEIIRCFLPRGWYVPTTPGTKFVTVGGAIAADVHGKNHHADGGFGRYVRSIDLMLASGEILRCSPTRERDVFWATVGGMGLTGVIVSAQVELTRVESAYFDVEYVKSPDLDSTLEAIARTDGAARYSVAWVDCLASGAALGRSVLMLGNVARPEQLPRRYRSDPLSVARRRPVQVPFDLPAFVLNSWSVKAFNGLYYGVNRDARRIVDYEEFFYPLDSIHHWNRIYGRRGFIQYQALFPSSSSRDGLASLLREISRSGRASFLGVLKSSGEASEGLLSFLYPGHFLALDIPVTDDIRALTSRLDRVVLDHGGRLYLAKDSTMTAETFAAMYPRLDEFRAVKAAVDPGGRFVSSQARRVGIV